jgi:phenylalanyl-tRNA synthetase beta chain
MVKNNFDHQCHDISAFEIGRIHFKKEGQYKEESAAGIVLTGKNRPAHWGEKPNECDFYDMKGIVENLLEETGVENVSFLQSDLPMFHPGRQAAIFVGELKVGSLGEVHPAIVRRLDVPQRIFFAEFDLHDLFRVRTNCPQMEEIPIYPGSSRDLTLTLPEETFVQKILDAIHAIPSKLLEKVIVKDIYRSDTIGKENKNLTLHFFYRDRSKTLSQEAVDAEHSRLREQIKQSLGR